MPGATAQYPGSVEIVSGDLESNGNVWAKNGAILKSFRCTGTTRDAWAPWFVEQLTAAGWELVHHPSFSATDGNVLVGEWRRGDYAYDLYDLSQTRLASLESQYGGGASCAGGYETLMR